MTDMSSIHARAAYAAEQRASEIKYLTERGRRLAWQIIATAACSIAAFGYVIWGIWS